MATLTWDSPESRTFEAGVDRGVLYVGTADGIPWNGLVNVTNRTESGDPTPRYLDGIKYRHGEALGEFAASIEAFTYPDEFLECEGLYREAPGLLADNQAKSTFGLSYRTGVGSGISGDIESYKIHIIYNAMATPSDKAYQTLGGDIDPMTFSWDISTIPEIVSGLAPTAHFVIDTSELGEYVTAGIEGILYGTRNTAPRLPSGQHLVDYLRSWIGLGIIPQPSTGLAKLTNTGIYDDLNGNVEVGLYTQHPNSRLTQTGVPGLYRLD